ncbi:cell division protein [Escherichia coli]|nr:cell division protein [Escherichia coli]
MGKLTLLLLAILVWLQYSLWFGKNGIHDYTRVNDDVAAQQATNAKLKARNDQLFAEIDDLMAARRRSKSVRVMNSA